MNVSDYETKVNTTTYCTGCTFFDKDGLDCTRPSSFPIDCDTNNYIWIKKSIPEKTLLTVDEALDNLQKETTVKSALDKQEGGNHYKVMKIQPIEYAYANNLGMLEGNVIKYVSRHKLKDKAKDIRKAIHSLELILQLEYPESNK